MALAKDSKIYEPAVLPSFTGPPNRLFHRAVEYIGALTGFFIAAACVERLLASDDRRAIVGYDWDEF